MAIGMDTAVTGSWTWRMIQNIKTWNKRSHGEVDFHLTQMLSGHGCFREYLHRIKKIDTPVCVDCQADTDDAEHAIFICDRWWRERKATETEIEGELKPETVAGLMMKNGKIGTRSKHTSTR